MEALQLRFTQLNTLRENAIRTLEHTTLVRLMHRNRNPHRRTPYFQRLEHVRRLLRRINTHVAWRLMNTQRGGRSAQKPPKRQRRSSRVSTISPADVDALAELTSLVECLVTSAILKAATRFTEELIAREHFLPFAVTVVALLARIYALERPLLRTLRGAVAEARVLVAPPPSRRLAAREDVGEVVASPRPTAQVPPVVRRTRPSQKRYFTSTTPGNVEKREEAQTVDDVQTPVPAVVAQVNPTGSLFDLMAEENTQLADLAKASIVSGKRFVASQPVDYKTMPKKTVGREQSVAQLSKRDDLEQMEVREPDSLPVKTYNKSENDVGKGEQESESENLDDIFGDLSD